jgi:hypothetical protein
MNKYPDVAVGLIAQSRLEDARPEVIQVTSFVKKLLQNSVVNATTTIFGDFLYFSAKKYIGGFILKQCRRVLFVHKRLNLLSKSPIFSGKTKITTLVPDS